MQPQCPCGHVFLDSSNTCVIELSLKKQGLSRKIRTLGRYSIMPLSLKTKFSYIKVRSSETSVLHLNPVHLTEKGLRGEINTGAMLRHQKAITLGQATTLLAAELVKTCQELKKQSPWSLYSEEKLKFNCCRWQKELSSFGTHWWKSWLCCGGDWLPFRDKIHGPGPFPLRSNEDVCMNWNELDTRLSASDTKTF